MSAPKFPCHREEGFLQIPRAKIQGVLAGEGYLNCSHAGKSGKKNNQPLKNPKHMTECLSSYTNEQ